MRQRRQKKVEEAIHDCLGRINQIKPSREELVVTLAQLLIRSGYSVYWGYEDPVAERPERIDKDTAEQLYTSSPSTGTTLMKIGFDLQEVLLLKMKGK